MKKPVFIVGVIFLNKKEISKILQYHKLNKFYELNAHTGMITNKKKKII